MFSSISRLHSRTSLLATVKGFLGKGGVSLVLGKVGILFVSLSANWYWAICKLLAVTICKRRTYLIIS
jgi:hypothetical protein